MEPENSKSPEGRTVADGLFAIAQSILVLAREVQDAGMAIENWSLVTAKAIVAAKTGVHRA